MQITPAEIASIDEAGMLDGAPVKMIKTRGGFHMAVGKAKGHFRDEVLAAGSHPAIVKFNLEKQYPGFQPAMMKSEGHIDAIVQKHSHFLTEDLRKSGHDIYSIQEEDSVNFHITKHNMKVGSVNGILDQDYLVVSSLNFQPEFSKGIAGATVEKALSCNAGLRFKK